MKKTVYFLAMIAIAMLMAACAGDDPVTSSSDSTAGDSSNTGGSSLSSADAALTGDLASFDIAIDKSTLSETIDAVPDATNTYYEDYVENFAPTATISISYNGTSASVYGEAENVTVTVDGADVTVNSEAEYIAYELNGTTTDGSFKIYSTKKFELILNGVSITNPTGAAVNNQGKRAYVVLNGENSLSDSSSAYNTVDGEDEKGTFFSEGKLVFSGTGSLSVSSNYKNGIVSDDYIYIRPLTNIYVKSASGHCLKSNEGVIMKGGVVNLETSATAGKGIKTDGEVQISGGRLIAITTGGGEYDSSESDVSAAAGIKAVGNITITDGEVQVKSTGSGGKGISTDAEFIMKGGAVYAITEGSTYKYSSSLDSKAKGIKSDGNMTIAGGQIMVRALGGEGSEGIETKGTLNISAGSIGTYTYDDGINSAGNMTVTGGYVYSYATGNDGIDANGNITISGGVVIGLGANSPEEGIDVAEQKTLQWNGGTIIGLGGGGESISGSQQKAAVSGVSVTKNNYLVVSSGSTVLFALKAPRSFSSSTMQVSSPQFASGTTYTLSTASSVSGTDFYGFISDATVSSMSSLATFTTSTSISGGMGGGMGGMGGGNQPGGGGGPGRW